MKSLLDFAASMWDLIVLWGTLLGVVFFGFLMLALEYQKWLIRRDMEKKNNADAQRYKEMAERLRQK